MSIYKRERSEEKSERSIEKQNRKEERALEKAERLQEKQERREEKAQEKAERAQERERRKQEEAPLSPEERFENFRSSLDPEAEQERLNDLERRKRIHSFLRTEYARLSAYVILTFVAIYLIKEIADHFPAIIVKSGAVLGKIGVILTPLILGFVIAYLLYPLKKFLQRQLEKFPFVRNKPGRSHTYGVVLSLVLTIGGIILLLSVVISAITHQVRMVSMEDLEAFTATLIASLNDIYIQMQQRFAEIGSSSEEMQSLYDALTAYVGNFTSNLGSYLTGSVTNITGFFGNLLFAVIFSIYFLLDSDGLGAYWDKVLRSISSRRFYRGVHLVLQDADTVFSGYIRGQMIDALIMFMMVSIALSVLNVQFAIIIGIMTGLGNLIPYVGPIIAYGSTVIVCLISGDMQKLVISVIVLFIIQTVDGNIINPRLLSSNIHVHPMLVIVALIIGSSIGGILGMLTAVPVAALVKIWFDRAIEMLAEHREVKKRQSTQKQEDHR